jgi:hypothetical protein
MMPWRPASLMAMTFCMTCSHCRRFGGGSLGQIDNQPTFRDVCTKRGKWFRQQENCFVAAAATKHSGMNCEQFELDRF